MAVFLDKVTWASDAYFHWMFRCLLFCSSSTNVCFITQSGKSFLSRKTCISCNSIFNKSSVEQIKCAFWTKDLSSSFPALRAKRIPIKVDIRIYYLSVDSSYNTLSLSNKTSNNASFGLFSVAQVNSILGWKLLKIDNMYSADPVLRKVLV